MPRVSVGWLFFCHPYCRAACQGGGWPSSSDSVLVQCLHNYWIFVAYILMALFLGLGTCAVFAQLLIFCCLHF